MYESKKTLRRRVEDLRKEDAMKKREINGLQTEIRELEAALREQEACARREKAIHEILLEKKEVALRESTKARLDLQDQLKGIEQIRDRYLPEYIADKEALRLAAGSLQDRAREISNELLRMSETPDGIPDAAAARLAELSYTLLPQLDYTDTQQLREAGFYRGA